MEDREKQVRFLTQQDVKESFLEDLRSGNWITVYRQESTNTSRLGIYCALIPLEVVERCLDYPSWDFYIGDGRPGFAEYWDEGVKHTEYLRFGDRQGIEPLVLVRDFHGVRPSHVELSEEFRLFHNLAPDAADESLFSIDDAGNESCAAQLNPTRVRVTSRAIRQFLAAHQIALAVFIDSFRYSPLPIEAIPADATRQEHRSDDTSMELVIAAYQGSLRRDSTRTLSRLLGKSVIMPAPRERCGIWPFESSQLEYEEFIVGTDDVGGHIYCSCDPSTLSPPISDAQPYLTPVFFRREVLAKYFEYSKYSVEDGYLRCAGLWGMRIDNNHPRYVIVFLGDLGRDLPREEQSYWKSFNVLPDGGLSEVEFHRQLLSEFAGPTSPDLLFKATFQQFQDEWFQRHNWHLFLPLNEGDSHHFKTLRVPLKNDQGEFDEQVLSLTKILIDSLNVKKLRELVETAGKNGKSLALFESFLKTRDVPQAEDIVRFLRDLQDLRSSGVAHRKGKKYEKACKRFHIDNLSLMDVMAVILRDATVVLHILSANLLEAESAQ